MFSVYGIRYQGRVVYVGETTQPLQRRRGGQYDPAIKQILESGAEIILIAECKSLEDMHDKERLYIRHLRPSFNTLPGGPGFPGKRTPEHQAKLNAGVKAAWANPEIKAKQSAAISKAKKGKKTGPCSPETRAKISASLKGQTYSEERNLAMSFGKYFAQLARREGIPRG